MGNGPSNPIAPANISPPPAYSPTSNNQPKSPIKPYSEFAPADFVRPQVPHVPTMFRWPYGGRKVYIVGSFNNWSQKIPMNYNSDENSFIVILNVPVGKHEYRFIVDNEERIDPKLPISSLNEKNNVIEVALPISNRPQTNLHDDFISTSVGSYRSDIEDENSSFSSENEADSFDGRRRLRDSLKAAQKIIINNKIQQQQPPKVPQSPLNNTGAAYLQQHHQQQTQQQQQPQKTTPTSPLTLQQPQQAIAPQTSSQPQQPKFLPPSAFQAPQQQQQPVQQPTAQAHTQAPRTHKEHKEEGDDQTQEEYGQEERVFVETKKAPPLLPPHLRFTPLNSNVRSATDPSILPTPLHVTVNHVYYATQNNISMIGVSQRYRDKFSTILLYKPSEPSNNIDSLHKVSESSINA